MLRYKAVENMKKNVKALPPATAEQVEAKYNSPVQTPAPAKSTSEASPTEPPKKKKKEVPPVDHTLDLKPPGFIHDQLGNVDVLAPLATKVSPLANWATATGAQPRLIRKVMESVADIHPRADLPKYVSSSETFMSKYLLTTVSYLYRPTCSFAY
jgi:hypothetical protein